MTTTENLLRARIEAQSALTTIERMRAYREQLEASAKRLASHIAVGQTITLRSL